MAKVRNGVVQFPPPLKTWCEAEGWNLFRVIRRGDDLLRIDPVLPADDIDVTIEFCASLQPEGGLWIPEELRRLVSLGDQSVMMRFEDGAISIYLRKVFETLGFRPI
jgi:hypothetical protein